MNNIKQDSSMCDYCKHNLLIDGMWRCQKPNHCEFEEIEENE